MGARSGLRNAAIAISLSVSMSQSYCSCIQSLCSSTTSGEKNSPVDPFSLTPLEEIQIRWPVTAGKPLEMHGVSAPAEPQSAELGRAGDQHEIQGSIQSEFLGNICKLSQFGLNLDVSVVTKTVHNRTK